MQTVAKHRSVNTFFEDDYQATETANALRLISYIDLS